MNKRRSVVLLSGGMDSSYAATWACDNCPPLSFLFVDYGQRGKGYEKASAGMVAGWLTSKYKLDAKMQVSYVELPYTSVLANPLMTRSGDLDPEAIDTHGNPATFVPGRNLLMIAIAAGVAYTMGANTIVGGWTHVDVGYPDCSPWFLQYAERTVSYALGFPLGTIKISAPVLYRNKEEIVKTGVERHVPFHLTRSCYGDNAEPCWECDSCILRAKAFMANNIRDPLCEPDRWTELEGRLQC